MNKNFYNSLNFSTFLHLLLQDIKKKRKKFSYLPDILLLVICQLFCFLYRAAVISNWSLVREMCNRITSSYLVRIKLHFYQFLFFFFLFFILIYIFFRIASERSQLRKYCFQNYIKSAVVEQVSISQIKFFFLFSLLLLYFISLANIRMIFTNNQLLQILRKMKYIMKFIDTLQYVSSTINSCSFRIQSGLNLNHIRGIREQSKHTSS